jgi:hypothetical protein
MKECVMQNFLQVSVLVAVLGLILPSLATATDMARSRGSVPSPVEGKLIIVKDTIFTVKDLNGRERQLKIDQRTAQFGEFHQGVHVQAWVLPDGRTESIIAFRTNRDTERELAEQP